MLAGRGVVRKTKSVYTLAVGILHPASYGKRRQSICTSFTLAICELREGGFFMRKTQKSILALTLAAMLTAMSVVIGIFCKSFLNFGGGLFRITFENLPIILAGTLFGPVTGAVVGVASDLVSYLLSPQIYPPNLIVTLGAAAVGFISGFISRVALRKKGCAQIIVSGIFAHLIGSILIKSIGLYQFFGWAVFWRIPTYAVIAAVEITVLCLLYKNATFRRVLGVSEKTER